MINMQVTVAVQNTSVAKTTCWRFTGCVAKLMHNFWRIYKIVGIFYFPDRWCFKKSMMFKASSLTVFTSWCHKYRCLFYSNHIFFQNCCHRATSGFISNSAKSSIKIGNLSLCQNTWIKLWLVSLLFSQKCPIRIMNISIKLVTPCWLITNCHWNHWNMIQYIIQIISTIRTNGNIRRI